VLAKEQANALELPRM